MTRKEGPPLWKQESIKPRTRGKKPSLEGALFSAHTGAAGQGPTGAAGDTQLETDSAWCRDSVCPAGPPSVAPEPVPAVSRSSEATAGMWILIRQNPKCTPLSAVKSQALVVHLLKRGSQPESPPDTRPSCSATQVPGDRTPPSFQLQRGREGNADFRGTF